MSRKRKSVREPIQVYLTPDERSLLDTAALTAGLSRAEVLRRGLRSFVAREQSGSSPMLGFARSLVGHDLPSDLAQRHDYYLVEDVGEEGR